MLNLKQFRRQQESFVDLLPYAAMIDDGIIVNKNGSLMAGWYYRGPDMASATHMENAQLSARTNKALSRMGTGWMTHHDAIRITANQYPDKDRSSFPDPVTRMIEEERRQQFEAQGARYESIYALTVTYMPPFGKQSRFAELMFEDNSNKKVRSLTRKILDRFREDIAKLEGTLGLRLQPMRGHRYTDEHGHPHTRDQLLQYVNYCITGNPQPVNLPPCPMYIDAILGQEFHTGVIPKIGDKYIGVIAIDGFPQESAPAILAALDQMPIRYRWNSRFIYMDPHEAVARLKKYRRKWEQKVRGIMEQIFRTGRSVINQDAQQMVVDAEEAIAEASGVLVAYGYYTSVVILMDEDREVVEDQAREVGKIIDNLGFNSRVETVNAVEAWLGSLPGHGVPNVRRPMMHTMNLADLLPLSSIWTGVDHNPCAYYPPGSPPLMHTVAQGLSPFRLNLHVDDVGHTLIFGPTGNGKSTLLALIAAQFRRYKNATIYAFDKRNALRPLTLAAGGRHYNIGVDNDLQFCPLKDIDSDVDQAWAEEWIATLLQLQNVTITPKVINTVNKAMTLLRGQSHHRSLTAFVTNLQNEELREALTHYTIDGALGTLLDAEDDTLQTNTFTTFEIENLMQMGAKNTIPVLLYLFRQFEKHLRGQPALLILDEAWTMFFNKQFNEKLLQWLKELRSKVCAVVMATQSLSDAHKSGLLDVLDESCPTKIYLPNSSARSEESRKMYKKLGLNDRQIEILAGATPKRHYYAASPQGQRLFELDLGPLALSFVGASSKPDLNAIEALRQKHKEKWPVYWLRKRGLIYAHYLS